MGYLARAALVLFVALAAFLVLRLVLGPGYLGLFNPDRTQDITAQAERSVSYLDADICASCHGDQATTLSSAAHRNVNCETCHGPGTAHVESGFSLAIEEPRALCVLCHTSLAALPAAQPQVNVEEHAGSLSCTVCHNAHSPGLGESAGLVSTPTPSPTQEPGETPVPTPTTQPSGPPRIPHTLEGRSQCTLCHGLTGIKPFPASHEGRTNETCLLCHQQQEGG